MAEPMGLLDHFHPPLFPVRRWESLHSYWASELGGWLNANVLPSNYFADVQLHVGSRFEVDIGAFEWDDRDALLADRHVPVFSAGVHRGDDGWCDALQRQRESDQWEPSG